MCVCVYVCCVSACSCSCLCVRAGRSVSPLMSCLWICVKETFRTNMCVNVGACGRSGCDGRGVCMRVCKVVNVFVCLCF